MPRAISREISEEDLQADLKRYRQTALRLGAAKAENIPASWVKVDERVRLRCLIPRCFNYGQCYNCPPFTPEPEFMRQAVGKFNWALLFKHDVIPVEDFAGDKPMSERIKHMRKTADLCSKLQTIAFDDGYHLALSFGSGSCKDALCNGQICQVLDSGRCRFPYRSRPSMESVGIDVYDLATRAGWEIYPVYAGVDPKLVPCAITVGILFVY